MFGIYTGTVLVRSNHCLHHVKCLQVWFPSLRMDWAAVAIYTIGCLYIKSQTKQDSKQHSSLDAISITFGQYVYESNPGFDHLAPFRFQPALTQ